MDEIARAYATLGVAPGAPVETVRKKYKALVRKWHPDRFMGDPQGQAEATARMRAINDAFRSVVAARASRAPQPSGDGGPDRGSAPGPAHARREPEFGRRLTRDEIDRMVEAMKGDGPLDWLLPDPMTLDKRKERRLLAACCSAGVATIVSLLADGAGMTGTANFGVTVTAWAIAFVVLLRVVPFE